MIAMFLTGLCYFIFAAGGNSPRIQHELDIIADDISVILYDDDNFSEYLLKREFRFYLTDQKNVAHFQINLPDEEYYFLSYLDIDGVPPKELFFQNKQDDTITVFIYSGTTCAYQFKTVQGADVRKPEGWDGWLTRVHVIDTDDDGDQELLFTAAASFDLQPRGLFAYDIDRGQELWSVYMGAFPRQTHVIDVNSDQRNEIIVSTTAVSNGSDRGGFTDRTSYVMAFDRAGTVLWTRDVGGVFSDALSWVGDIDGDGAYDVIVVECEGPAYADEPNIILILDAASGATRKFIRSGDQYLGMAVCDINRDDEMEIIVGNTDGILRIYSNTLDLVAARDFGAPLKVFEAADYDGDGTAEVMCMQNDNRLLIVDEYLNPLAEYTSDRPGGLSVWSVQEGRKTKFIVRAGTDPGPFALMSLSAPALDGLIGRQISYFFLIPVAVLVLIIVFLIVQNRRLSSSITQHEHYTGQILEWSGLAQRLAHEIKNPLSTINLTLQRVQEVCNRKLGTEAAQLDKYTTSILEEIERVRATVDKFMRILAVEKSTFQPGDINRIVEAVVHKYDSRLPEAVRIQKNLAKDLPLVPCDENQLSMAFTNVVENALEAMAGSGTLTLRTSFTEKVAESRIIQYVEIRIEDTGVGMTREQQKKLFKPFQSSKTGGTGLGLVIARQIIERHNGTIGLASKRSIGTVVTINIPVARPRQGV